MVSLEAVHMMVSMAQVMVIINLSVIRQSSMVNLPGKRSTTSTRKVTVVTWANTEDSATNNANTVATVTEATV